MNLKLRLTFLSAITAVVVILLVKSTDAIGNNSLLAQVFQEFNMLKTEISQPITSDTIIVAPNHQVSDVVRGSRPYVDFMAIPDSMLLQGHLLVKFHAHAEPFLAEINAENIVTGIRDLDALNQEWKVTEMISDYDTLVYKKEFAERHRKWGLHLWYQINFPEGTDIKSAMLAYRKLSSWFEVVEPEIMIRNHNIETEQMINGMSEQMMNTTVTVNDPMFNQQWGLNNTGQTGGNINSDIDLPEAWAIETGKKNVIVAIIDSGVDTTHTDLRSNFWVGNGGEKFGYNFYSNNSNIVVGSHGTHVAGIIGAINNNNDKVSSIAGGNGSNNSGVSIMSCQVSNNSGSSFSTRAIKRAFIWSADRGVAITQNSWGTLPPNSYNSDALDGIDYFIENGGGAVLDKGLVIFSAGNSNLNAKIFPAAYERVISVAATSHSDVRSSYSSFGSWVDISAPGGDGSGAGRILSTYPMSINNGVGNLNGTSQASPHVTGVAALVVSKAAGKLSSDDVRTILLNESENHYSVNPNFVGLLGKGRVNAHKSLVKTEALINEPVVNGVSNFIAQFNECNTVRLTWNNPQNKQVVIARSQEYKGLIGFPDQTYQPGDMIEGGGEVIYVGNGNNYNMPVTEYINLVGFKIWHLENGVYSKGSFGILTEVYPCSPPILYVKQGGTGDGTSWANASGDLQKMIDRAAPGSSVYVAKGTYKPIYVGGDSKNNPNASDRNNFFLLNKRVRVLGGFPDNKNNAGLNDRNSEANPTILSGDLNGNDNINTASTFSENTYHVLVTVDTRESYDINFIDGFTIMGGNANGTGGVSVRGIQITNNFGGGWFNAGGVFKVANLKIENNRSSGNGGGWYNLSGSVYLSHVKITGNRAVNGGGWFNRASNPELFNCVIENNTVSGEGGGWYNYADSPSVFNCNISNNQGARGGGIYWRVGNPIVYSSLVSKNTVTLEGGGIYKNNGLPNLFNATISDNNAQLKGGGIYSGGVANSLLIYNSIIWGNESSDNLQVHLTNSNIVNLKNCIIENWQTNEANLVFDINPEFSNPAAGDFSLSACSPSINKGNNALIAGLPNPVDLAGLPRFNNRQVDLGAYEFQGIPTPASLSENDLYVQMPVFNGVTHLNDGCDFIATIDGVDNSQGYFFTATAKLAEQQVILSNGWGFVKRYFEIFPSKDNNTLFSRITLYFTKEEFDLYNQHYGFARGLPLPQNLKVIQFRGEPQGIQSLSASSDAIVITPNINDIVLDEVNDIWKVTFNVYGFSNFFVTSQSGPDALPVNLTDFVGKQTDDKNVLLNWNTTFEADFKEFEVERSTESLQDFKSIGKVAAMKGEGLKNYSFKDELSKANGIMSPNLYYRLKMIDLDGSYTYSKWISVSISRNDSKPEILVYPNPAHDQVFFKYSYKQDAFSIEIFDSSGAMIKGLTQDFHQSLPLNHLAAGQYLIRLKGNGWQETKKIFIK